MDREPVLILADIIENFMSLGNGRIFIDNQNFKMPTDTGLFVVLQQISSNNYSTTNKFIPADEGQEGGQELITYRSQESYNINVMSRDSSARQRKEEVIMALNSDFSKNQQEKYSFKLAKISNSFNNISDVEGEAVLSRYVFNINLIAWYSSIRDTAYYDQFSNQILIDNNDT